MLLWLREEPALLPHFRVPSDPQHPGIGAGRRGGPSKTNTEAPSQQQDTGWEGDVRGRRVDESGEKATAILSIL